MEDAIEQLQTKDTKERMAGVERLQTLLEHSRKGLSANEVEGLVDASLVLLKDNNFRVAQGTLQALASAAALAGEHLKLHFNSLLPAIVERLGDGKQPVRDAGRQLLLALMEISSPTIIVERARNFAWGHRKWRVREEFARTVASAVNLFAATELPFQRMLLPSVLQLLEDSNSNVREAAMLCLEEMYRQGGSQFREELQGHQLRPAQVKDISSRFHNIEPVRSTFESVPNQIVPNKLSVVSMSADRKVTNLHAASARTSSPRVKAAPSETSVGGDGDGEHQVDAIRVHSDKELAKEIEKAAGLLTPEQDWSVRIGAMQRLEGLVAGGATEYASFMALMKQLVGPLNIQLADRRSSIVKQACQLLNLMSKELLVKFEVFAESFIPALFKLVVITVLVIAESADICIKTMLRNCRVSRVLPKLMECAKHDRNAVLRARCCDYALLVLEQWGDSPEIQRSVELYEELIKCCVGDAMSEVRSSARMCYRVFYKRWPERARRIFVTFDASVQRLLNEEGGISQKQQAFPSVQEWGSYGQQQQLRQSSNMPLGAAIRQQAATDAAPAAHSNATAGHSDRTSSILSGLGLLTLNRLYQSKSVELGSERSLERVLQASQQQVSAVQNMLKGMDSIDKGASRIAGIHDRAGRVLEKESLSTSSSRTESRDPGGSHTSTPGASAANGIVVDYPSARDPPFPASAPASSQTVTHTTSRPTGKSAADYHRGNGSASPLGVYAADNFTAHQFGTSATERPPQPLGGQRAELTRHDFASYFPSGVAAAKRVPQDKPGANSAKSHSGEVKGPKHAGRIDYMEKGYVEKGAMDPSFVPGFQRPLLRQKSSGSCRSLMEENPVLVQFNARGGMHKYTEGYRPLSDALSEGLSVNADWSARVGAFTFLRKMLQQGPRGLQEINQSFGLVMKLFSAHLDDPHHKVAHAALATLAELVPVCRKPFEAYLERILPHMFGRLVDTKEVIRQLGTTALEVIGNTYGIDSLLPALLRSLDEQRSLKAKITVIEFATAAFAKLALNGETPGGSGLLKLWLAKLGPLANDKNPKLKETAVAGIISVYSHFDSATVLNFILGLSIEEQSMLRRSLKQHTPRIEVDLMTLLQSKSQRARSKNFHDQLNSASATNEMYLEPTRSAYSILTGSTMGYSSSSVNSDGSRTRGSNQQDHIHTGDQSPRLPAAGEPRLELNQSFGSTGSTGEVYGHLNSEPFQSGRMEVTNGVDAIDAKSNSSATWLNEAESSPDTTDEFRNSPLVDTRGLVSSEQRSSVGASPDGSKKTQRQLESQVEFEDKFVWKTNHNGPQDPDSTVPGLLQQLTNWGTAKPAKKKYEALLQLLMTSRVNDPVVWSEYFPQILTVTMEAMEDSDGAVKELALSGILEMLSNQRQRLDECIEVLLEKLLYSTTDADLKVSTAAERCKTIMLTEFDTHRCLATVVQLLVSEDEKLLVTSISSLTKLVGRLPSEELMAQLPSFLPALFIAFGNQNPDVRKAVVFCLVDMYIVLGKAFVPYLGSLSSTQLRLVTIYANRISQARKGTSLESSQL